MLFLIDVGEIAAQQRAKSCRSSFKECMRAPALKDALLIRRNYLDTTRAAGVVPSLDVFHKRAVRLPPLTHHALCFAPFPTFVL